MNTTGIPTQGSVRAAFINCLYPLACMCTSMGMHMCTCMHVHICIRIHAFMHARMNAICYSVNELGSSVGSQKLWNMLSACAVGVSVISHPSAGPGCSCLGVRRGGSQHANLRGMLMLTYACLQSIDLVGHRVLHLPPAAAAPWTGRCRTPAGRSRRARCGRSGRSCCQSFLCRSYSN